MNIFSHNLNVLKIALFLCGDLFDNTSVLSLQQYNTKFSNINVCHFEVHILLIHVYILRFIVFTKSLLLTKRTCLCVTLHLPLSFLMGLITKGRGLGGKDAWYKILKYFRKKHVQFNFLPAFHCVCVLSMVFKSHGKKRWRKGNGIERLMKVKKQKNHMSDCP